MWWLPAVGIEDGYLLKPTLATRASKNQTATLKNIKK
jgi:hypothetical protein